MYIKCLKNYGHALRYVFFIMGILFMMLLIGISVFRKNTSDSFNSMVTNISDITGNTDLSFNVVWDAITESFAESDKNEMAKDISVEGAYDKSNDLVSDAFSKVIDNYTNYASEIAVQIGIFVETIFISFVIIICLQIFGLIVGENVTAILVGRAVLQKRSSGVMGKLLNRVCGWIYKIAVILIIVISLSIVPLGGIILILLYPLINCFMSLLSCYITYGKGRPKFKQVCSIKNIFILFFADLTTIILAIVIALIVFKFISFMAAFYIMISLFAVTAASNRINAYTISEISNDKVSD